MKKVAIYVRVSSQEQANEGYSIQEQTERLTKYCEAHGWILVKVYTDPGFTGANRNRPALQMLCADVAKSLFDTVLVYKLDRLSRSQKDTLYIIEDVFLKNGISFVSMNENFDTGTPFGRAMIGILSVFAQLERDQIRERVQMGHDARAKEGYFHGGGYAPIGYDYIDGLLTVNEYEASIVRKAYTLFLDGLPVHSIYLTLEKEYPAGTRFGAVTYSSVKSMLTTILYAGYIKWKGALYPGKHEAIIPYEQFQEVQRLIKRRQIDEPHRLTSFQHTTILGGIMFCGYCGARYFCKNNTASKVSRITQRYYTCYSRGKTSKKMIRDPNCKNKSWNVHKLDAIILNEIAKLELSRDFVSYNTAPDNSGRIQSIKTALASADKKLEKLVDLYTDDTIPVHVLSERISRLNAEKEALEAELSNLQAVPDPDLSYDQANKILDSFQDIIATGDNDLIRNMVRSLIDSIIIRDEDIEIHWKFTSF